MLLYHGSSVEVLTLDIIIYEKGRDFGFGFYTTDIEEQAVRWAERKSVIEKRQGRNMPPILNIYEYDEKGAKDALNIKDFGGATIEWLDFIIGCRTKSIKKHQYDITKGNIANDNVGETISFVMSGVMRKEDALKRLKFQKINNQICFNTQKALCYLKFKESRRI